MVRTFLLPSSWAVSGLLHGGAAALLFLGARRGASTEPPPRPAMEFRVAPPAPRPAEPPRATQPLDPPKPDAPRSKTPPKAAPPPPSSKAPPPAEVAEAPLDLTGNTLTADKGAFSTRVGNGEAMGGPIGAGRAPSVPPVPPVPSASSATTGGTEVTRKEDLSRLPEPPDLTSQLLAHYPEKARATGASGHATLQLVIGADGRVSGVALRSSSSPEFGRACVETLRGTHWSPPLDRAARPTATRVGYTCYFDVR